MLMLLLLPGLLCPAAYAGTWSLVYTASGTETTKPIDPSPSNTFSDNSTGTNTVTSAKAFSAGFNQPGGASTSITVNVSVTGTWVLDPSLPSDPAPPSVEVIETASIYQDGFNGDGTLASGTPDDGLKDAPILTTDSQGYAESLSATPTGTVPVQHLSTKTGSSFTLSHTLTASSTAAAYTYHNTDADAKFVSYSVTIHPQPYGWYDAGYDSDLTGGKDNSGGPKVDDPNGTLTFRYRWHSTNGNIRSLGSKSLHVYEHVDYTGNPGTFLVDNGIAVYRPPSPPIGLDLSHESPQAFEIGNPEISVIDATIGATYDIHSAWPTQTPLSKLMVVAPQVYEFNDDATGEVSVVLFDCGTITDGIHVNPNSFYIRKSGYYMEKPL